MLSGEILAELGKQEKDQKKVRSAIVRLTKALTLCASQNKTAYFEKDLSTLIYRAKKLLWYLKFDEIKETRIQTINEYKEYMEKDPSLSKEQIQGKI